METPATLSREGEDFVLRDGTGDELRRLPRYDLRMDSPLGQLERRVALRDGSVFLTDDGAGLDAILGTGKGHILHGSERYSPRLVFVILAALIGIAGIWRFGLPALVEVAVWLTPPAVLSQIDSASMATFDQLLLSETTLHTSEQTELREVFDTLVLAMPPAGEGVNRNLLFRSSDIGPNAFALPGGTVLMTDELVDLMDSDVDALAGVLAHELIHVEKQHGLRALYRSLTVYVVIAMVAGDTGPILDEILLEGNALLSLAGSREAEAEADAGGVLLMAKAGYDPEGLATFFDVIRREFGDGGGYLSSHPGSDERAAEVRRMIDDL